MNVFFSRVLLVLVLLFASTPPALAGTATQTLATSVDHILVLLSDPAYKNTATRPELRRQLITAIEKNFDTRELPAAPWERTGTNSPRTAGPVCQGIWDLVAKYLS
jgi:hypothetical protein